MTLKADPASIERYGALVARAGDDLTAGREHLMKHGHPAASGGEIFMLADDWHRRTVDEADAALGLDAQVAGESALNLGLAADYYRSTDHAAAQGFDRAIPPTLCPPVSMPSAAAGRPAFADAHDARARLVEPEAGEFGFRADPLRDLEALSLTATVMDAVKQLFGFDPIEDIVSRVLGDWEQLSQCGIALKQLAELCADAAGNVGQGTADVRDVWAGNAADAAVTYFLRLDTSIAGLADPLRALSDAHLQAAQGAWETAEALKSIVSTLIDEAVVVAALVTTGSILIETGIGPLVSYGVAAVELGEMYETYETAMKLVHTLYAAVLALGGVINSAVATMAGLPRLTVMTDAYRHPAEPGGPGDPEPPGRGHSGMAG